MELKTFYKIRFSDCDPFNHLNNSGYIDYMLNAREDHLKEFHDIDMTALYKKGSGWMVSRHEIVYLSPALYNEMVCIESALIKLSDDTLLVEMAMWDENQQQLRALLWTKFIHINLQTGMRDKHPNWFLEMARQFEDTELQQYATINDRLASLRR
ncbi:acyl-CoA thioesterase [Flavobacterium album]|uniref:Acyl-CoA thioesterase n=1 Tax=Flavobacterium album TaxID=2175091 RepID=A0A2S1QZ94_9FLAO|nr:acyl-CoA thioesterase [Flavobacterium album]AWH85737.1 acyl-CoA thioesterase [Flavobacterium album]